MAHFEKVDQDGQNLWFPARWEAFYSRRGPKLPWLGDRTDVRKVIPGRVSIAETHCRSTGLGDHRLQEELGFVRVAVADQVRVG